MTFVRKIRMFNVDEIDYSLPKFQKQVLPLSIERYNSAIPSFAI